MTTLSRIARTASLVVALFIARASATVEPYSTSWWLAVAACGASVAAMLSLIWSRE